MDLRQAEITDVEDLAVLVFGSVTQPSTSAGMRLFGISGADDALELNRVMISSTESWRTTTVVDSGGSIVGMVQVGDASMAFTDEVVELARRLHGQDFMAFLGPRLAAQSRVQVAYPARSLRISEIHVDPGHRGSGIGSSMLRHVLEHASRTEHDSLGLQTLTTNPSRAAFEAWGFRVAATTTDTEFEDFTGASGYHLMVRDLQAVGGPAGV